MATEGTAYRLFYSGRTGFLSHREEVVIGEEAGERARERVGPNGTKETQDG